MKEPKRGFKYGYKVVRHSYYMNSRSYVSSHAIQSIIPYSVNKWAKPHKHEGPLAVFDNYDDASDFVCNDMDLLMIFKCKYIPSKHKRYWHRCFGRKVFAKSMPRGKTFAKAVKLIRKVSDNLYPALDA